MIGRSEIGWRRMEIDPSVEWVEFGATAALVGFDDGFVVGVLVLSEPPILGLTVEVQPGVTRRHVFKALAAAADRFAGLEPLVQGAFRPDTDR